MIMMAGQYSYSVDPRFRTILPYVYLPFTGMVMSPLAALPFAQSAIAFQILNHVFILGGMLLAAVAVGWRRDPWVLAAMLSLVAFNYAVYRQNNAGQLNAVLVFGYGLLFLGIARGWHGAAIGFIAAFLMLFKLSPGILLFYFLLRKEWKNAAWMIAWAVVLTGISVGIYGLQRHLEYLPVLSDMGYGKSTWSQDQTFWRDPYNQSINALMHRLLVERPGSGITPWLTLSAGAANALTWLASMVILVLFFVETWKSRVMRGMSAAPAFALAVCASLLLPSIMWDHYLVQLLVPGVLLTAASAGPPARRWAIPAIGLSFVVISLWVAQDAEAFRQGAGLLVTSIKLVPVLVLFLTAAMMVHSRNSLNGN
jgi:hypothetical protein